MCAPLRSFMPLVFLTVCLAALPAASTGTPNTLSAPADGWSNAFGVPGVDGVVRSMATFGDLLIIGGSFDSVDGIHAPGIAAWDGLQWSALGDPHDPVLSGTPTFTGVVAFRNGLVAVGYAQNTQWRAHLVCLFFDGARWSRLHLPNDEVADTALSGAVVYQGDLFVGGRFTTLGGVACNNIARWDGTAWHALRGGTEGNTGEVSALTVYQDRLIAGGDFSRAGGVPLWRVGAWDGGQWTAVGFGVLGAVYSLAVDGGDLVAGGWFDHAEGQRARSVARWNGTRWLEVGGGIGRDDYSSPVYALLSTGNGLWVGGSFEQAGGTAVQNLARWDGAQWEPAGNQFNFNPWGYIRIVHEHRGTLFVGGAFGTAGGRRVVSIAQRYSDGTWGAVGHGQGLDRGPSVLAADGDGVVAAGAFEFAGSTPVAGFARWNGTTWESLAGLTNVTAVRRTTLGLLAAGSPQRFARPQVHLRGHETWVPLGDLFSASVYEIVEYQGRAVAGGAFTKVGDVAMHGVAVWNGAAWEPFGDPVPEGRFVSVTRLVADSDRLWAAGYSGFGSTPFVSVRLGAHWKSLPRPPASVMALATYGGRPVIGVSSSPIGTPESVWTWDGHRWVAMGSLGPRRAVALVTLDGVLFAATEGYSSRDAALLRWNGSMWDVVSPNFDSSMKTALAHGGGIYVAGDFKHVGDIPSEHMAFWGARTIPVAVEGLGAQSFAGGIRLTWSIVDAARVRTVRVERAPEPAGPFASVSADLGPAREMSFDDTAAEPGVAYWYRIVLLGAGGLETPSAVIGARRDAAAGETIWLGAPRFAADGTVLLQFSAGRGTPTAQLAVYDVRGRRVRAFVHTGGGAQTIHWDRRDATGALVPRGIYFVRLDVSGTRRTRRMAILQ